MSRKTIFKNSAWTHFRKRKPVLISLYLLLILVVVAMLAPVISNDKPLYATCNGQTFFPAFSISGTVEFIRQENGPVEVLQSSQVDWKQMKLDRVIWAPVPFYPGKSDSSDPEYRSPGTNGHWLGTTKNGGDVLSGLIHGTRISLSIGLLAMLIASIIGITLGAMAGYFGDHRMLASRGSLWMAVAGIIPAYFYGFYVHSSLLSDLLRDGGFAIPAHLLICVFIFLSILFIFYKTGKLLHVFSFFSKKISVHVDSLVSRTIEVFISIPRLILIISIAAIARPSFMNLILIIGFTSWTEIARFTRAELLRTKNSDYIETSRAMGFTNFRIILRHALPNALAPATVAIVFGIASAILIESGLSFLGIGVPQDVVTWGSLLFAGKENFEAWWLVVFPGLAIFLTVTAFNLVGDGLRDAMDVKGRSL